MLAGCRPLIPNGDPTITTSVGMADPFVVQGDGDWDITGSITASADIQGNTFSCDTNATVGGTLDVTGVSRFADGTAGAPSISFTNYPTTGIFFGSADAVGITTSGVERFRFLAADFLALQARGPVVRDFAATVALPSIVPDRSSLGSGLTAGVAGELDLTTGGVSAINIDSSRNVSIAAGDLSISTDDNNLILGASADASLGWNTTQTDDLLALGLGASNVLMICEKADTGFDFQTPASTHPRITLCSAGQTTSDQVSMWHDGAAGIIDADTALTLRRDGSTRFHMGSTLAIGLDVTPNTNVSYDLGSSSLKWLDFHHGGDLYHTGSNLGFFSATPAAKPTGVAVTAAGVHAALVTLGLIS